MVKGLNQYNTQERVFHTVFIYQGLFAGVATSIWYVINKKYRLISSNQYKSIPIVFILSAYLTKGFAYQLVAARNTQNRLNESRYDNLMDYKIQLRNSNIIN
jgi:hypothetical protein